MRGIHHWLFLIIIIFGLAGCAEPAPNQPLPAATSVSLVTPLPSPTQTTIPPTAFVEAIVAETAEPLEPTQSVPTPLPTPEPTEPAVEPSEDLSSFIIQPPPVPLRTGETAVIEGRSPHVGGTVTVAVHAGPHLLATAQAVVDGSGAWVAELPLPFTVSGAAEIKAADDSEMGAVDVKIIASGNDPQGIDLMVSQPVPDSTAVSGAPLFFAGDVANAIDRSLTIGFLANCNNLVARQNITLTGNDAVFWNAIIILPRDIDADMGCASVATGNTESNTWREVLIPLSLIDLDDEAAVGLIQIGNRLDMPPQAGSNVTLFGSALNLTTPELNIEWRRDEGEQTALTRTVPVDSFGYWEANFELPPDFFGETVLNFKAAGEDAVTISEVTYFVTEAP